MSTTFAVMVDDEEIEVAFRCGTKIRWLNQLGKTLTKTTKVIPLGNSAQGIYTIGDIMREVGR